MFNPWLAGCASTARQGVDEEAPEGDVEQCHASSAGVRLKAPRPVIAGSGGGGHEVEHEVVADAPACMTARRRIPAGASGTAGAPALAQACREAAEGDASSQGQDDIALEVVEGL